MTTKTLTTPGLGEPAEDTTQRDDDLSSTPTIPIPKNGSDPTTQRILSSEEIHEGFLGRTAALIKEMDLATQRMLSSEEIHKGFLERKAELRQTVAYADALDSEGFDAARGHVAPHVPPKRGATHRLPAAIGADRQQRGIEPTGPRSPDRAAPSEPLVPPHPDAVGAGAAIGEAATVPALSDAQPKRPRRRVAITGGVMALVVGGAGVFAVVGTCKAPDVATLTSASVPASSASVASRDATATAASHGSDPTFVTSPPRPIDGSAPTPRSPMAGRTAIAAPRASASGARAPASAKPPHEAPEPRAPISAKPSHEIPNTVF